MTALLLSLIFFFFGIFFGSFLQLVIDRLERKETIVSGRSHCDFCLHPLIFLDLIPVLSFVFLSGKCRYCHKFYGWKYVITELITGIGFAIFAYLDFFVLGYHPSYLFFDLLFFSSCIIVFFSDIYMELFRMRQ